MSAVVCDWQAGTD